MSDCVVLQLAGEAATRALGRDLGQVAMPGDVIALTGPLGAGKTTLVQGLAEGLAITGPVPSPTFVLAREYRGRLPLAHLDAYRLMDARAAVDAGLDGYLPGDGVTAVEWADRIEVLVPEGSLWLSLRTSATGRSARLTAPDLPRWLRGREGIL